MNKDNYTMLVIKDSYKEFIYKIITAIFIRGLLLIIPIFWSDTINKLSEGEFSVTYSYIIIIVILSCFYYVWQYLNQVSWYQFYNKLSLGYTALITKNNTANIKKVTLGEYTNVINTDIDILCNFLGNGVARVIQVLEIVFIYFYFLTQNIYIFLITIIISILMVTLLIISSNQVKEENIKRKTSLDRKTVVAHQMYDSLKDGNYNVIFKSAKYNHVRNEIDTETMQELGTRKRQQDGDEEKTHLCIRLAKGQNRFLAVHESNHYGISINCIVDYLNTQFVRYNEDTDDKYHYTLSHEIMPGDDFLDSLKKARTTSALKLTVSKEDIRDDFMQFANRNDIDDEVEIWFKRPKGAKKFPDNLIKAYYDDMQSNNRIKKISVRGTNAAGQFEIDTDLMKMKHYLSVKAESVTNEVNSEDFFTKAQGFIDETRTQK